MTDSDAAHPLSLARIVELFPQKGPFLFVDRLLEVSPQHAVGEYTFRGDEFFYAGHFPGMPVTPGVILTELMAQVSQGIFIHRLATEGKIGPGKSFVGYFTDAQFEIMDKVLPPARVTCRAELVFWRMGKVRAKAQILSADGKTVATAVIGAMVVAHSA